jgi:hypothetical protein
MKKLLFTFALFTLAFVGVGCGDDEQPQDDTEQVEVGVSDVENDAQDDAAKMETDLDDEATDEDEEESSDDEDEESAEDDDEADEESEEPEEEATISGETLSAPNFDLTAPSSATIAQLAGTDMTEYFVTDCADADCFVDADAVGDDYTLYVVTGNEADLEPGERFTDIYQSTSPDQVAGESVTFGTDAQREDGPGPNYAYYKADEKTGEFVWIEVSYVEGTGLEAAKETLENINWK